MLPNPHLLPTWLDLTARLDASGITASWATAEPALTGLISAADLTYLTSRQHPRRHEALGAVINLAAADADAVLVALHLLRSGAGSLANKLSDLSPFIEELILGELTVQVLISRRGAGVVYAAGLLRETNAALLKELLPFASPAALVGASMSTEVLASGSAQIDHADAPAGLLADLFQWAKTEQIASAADLAILLELEVAAEGGSGARHRVARTHGVHERTIRRRRDRTLAALQQASNRYLRATA